MASSGRPNQDAKAQADARALKEVFDASAAAKAFVDNSAMEAEDIVDLSEDAIEQAHSAPAAPSVKVPSLTETLINKFDAIEADARIKAYAAYLEIAKLFAAQPADLKEHEIRITEITYQPIIEALINGDVTLAAFPITDNSNDGLTRATEWITQEYRRRLNPEPIASAAAAAPSSAAAPALDKWAQAAPARNASVDEAIAREAAREALSQTFARATDNAAAELQRRADAEAKAEQEARARVEEAERAAKAKEAADLERQRAELQAEQRRRDEQKQNESRQKVQVLNTKVNEFKAAVTALKRSADTLGPNSTLDEINKVNEGWVHVDRLASSLKEAVKSENNPMLELKVLEIILGLDTSAIREVVAISREAWLQKKEIVETEQGRLSNQLASINNFVESLRQNPDANTLNVVGKSISRFKEDIVRARAQLNNYPQDIQDSATQHYDRLNNSLDRMSGEVANIQRLFEAKVQKNYEVLRAHVANINETARKVPQEAKNIQENTLEELRIKAMAFNDAYNDVARDYREMLDAMPSDIARDYRGRVGLLDTDKEAALNALNAAIARVPTLIDQAQASVAAEEKALDGIIQTIAKVAKADPGPNVDADTVAGYRDDLRRFQQQYREQEQRYAAAIGNLPARLQPQPPSDLASKTKQKDAAVRDFEAGIIAKSEIVLTKIQSYQRILDELIDFNPADEKAVVAAHRAYVRLAEVYQKEDAAHLPGDLDRHIGLTGIKAKVGFELATRKERLVEVVRNLMSQFIEELSTFLEQERPRLSGGGIATDLFKNLIGLNVLVAELKAMLDENADLGRIPSRAQVDAITNLLPELQSYERKLNLLREVIQSDLYPKSDEFVRVMGVLPTVEKISETLDEARNVIAAADQRFAEHRRELQRILEVNPLLEQQAAFLRQVTNEANPDNTHKFLRQLQDGDPGKQELEILIRRIEETIRRKSDLLAADERAVSEYAANLQANVEVLDGLLAQLRRPEIIASPEELRAVERQVVKVRELLANQPQKRAEDSLPADLAARQRGVVSEANASIGQAGAVLANARGNRENAEREAGVLSQEIRRVHQQFEAIEFKEEEPEAQLQAKWNLRQHSDALLALQNRAQDLLRGVGNPVADQKDGVEALKRGVEGDLVAAERALALKDAEFRSAYERRHADEANAQNVKQGLRAALNAIGQAQGQWDFADAPEVEGVPGALVLMPEPNPTHDQIAGAQLAQAAFLEKVDDASNARLPADLKDEIKAVINEVNLGYAAANYEKSNDNAEQKWDALKTNALDRFVDLDTAIIAARQPVNDLQRHLQNHPVQRQALLDAKQDVAQKLPVLRARMADEKKIIADEAKQAVLVDAAIAPAIQLFSELPADLKRGMNDNPPALAPKIADAKQINDDGKFYRGVVKRNAVVDWVDVLNNELDRAIAVSDIQHQVVLVDEFKRLNDMRNMANAAYQDLNAQQPAARAAQLMANRPALDNEIKRLEENIRRFNNLVAYQKAYDEEKVWQAAEAANPPAPAEAERRAIIRKHIEIPRLQWLLIRNTNLHLGSDESLVYRALNKTTPPPGFNAWLRANPNAIPADINNQLQTFVDAIRAANPAGFNDAKVDALVGNGDESAVRVQRVAVNNNYKRFANTPADIKLEKPDAILQQGAVLTSQEEKASARHQTKLSDSFVRDLLIQRRHAVRADADLAPIRDFDYRHGTHAQFVGLVNQRLINRLPPAEEKNIITEAEFNRAKGLYLASRTNQLDNEYKQRTEHLKARVRVVRDHAVDLIKHQQHYQTGNVPAEYKHVVASLNLPITGGSKAAFLALRNFNYREGTINQFNNVMRQFFPNATPAQLATIQPVFVQARQIAQQSPDLNANELQQNQRMLAETIDANLAKLSALRGEVAEVRAIAAEFAALHDPDINICRNNIEGRLHVPRCADDKADPAHVTEAAYAQLSKMDKLVVAMRNAQAHLNILNARLVAIDREVENLNKLKREIPEEYRQESQKKTYFTATAEVRPLSDMATQLDRFGITDNYVRERRERIDALQRANPVMTPAVQAQIATLQTEIANFAGHMAQIEYKAANEEKIKITRALSGESEARFSGVELKNEDGVSTRAMFVEQLVKTESGETMVRSNAFISDSMSIAEILLANDGVVSKLKPLLGFGGLDDTQRRALCYALDDWLHENHLYPTKKNILTFFESITEGTAVLTIQPSFRSKVEAGLPPGASEAQIAAAVDSTADAIKNYMSKSLTTTTLAGIAGFGGLAREFEKAIDDSVGLRREYRSSFTSNYGVKGAERYQFNGGYEDIPSDAVIRFAKTYVHNACAHKDATVVTVNDIRNPALLAGIVFEIRAANLKRQLEGLPLLIYKNATKYDDPPSPSHPAVGYYIKRFEEVIAPTMDERFRSTPSAQLPRQQAFAVDQLKRHTSELQARVELKNPNLDKAINVNVPLPRKPHESERKVFDRYAQAGVIRVAQRQPQQPPQNPVRHPQGNRNAPVQPQQPRPPRRPGNGGGGGQP